MTVEAALALLRQGDAEGALALLERPAVADAAAGLAARGMALLARNQPEAARALLRRAIAGGDTSPVTALNLALADYRCGQSDAARAAMAAMAERLPDWDEPSLRLAECLRAEGRADEAVAAYRRVLAINPHRPEALAALGGLLLLRGQATDARDLLLRCCGVDPDRAEAWDALGLAMMQCDEASQGLSAIVEAQRLVPHSMDYALHGVEAAFAADEAEAERARLQRCCDADPANPAWHLAFGVMQERLGERAAAIDALETAAVLAPEAPLPSLLLGGVLARSSRLKEAEAALRRAGVLEPDNPKIMNDLATVLMRMHRHAEARTLLLDLLDRHGRNQNALCNLANTTVCLGLQEEAVALAREAIALAPAAPLPRRALCNTLPYAECITGSVLLAASRDCSDRLPRTALPEFGNQRDPDRPLTIGLLSGSFKTHPVGWLTIAGCETLDRSAFSLVCLAQNSLPGDMIAQRYQAVARDWIDVDTLDDVALATRARALGIDVLIDLGGYGDGSRMAACAHRLAPVQVKWVGMQNHSSGLAEMDWIITDRWEIPPALESVYSERMLRLPDGYVCYSPPPYAPDVVPLPALANGYVTFGCFNNLAKVTPAVIATWSRVLALVPNARLVLKTHQFSDVPTCERIHAAFAACGMPAERIELRGRSPHRAFMAEYNHIDLVLDPFPYSGGLTTCEALWMGVPTVTLPADSFASRHSLSHLSNAGLSGWAARDTDEYVALAVTKAADLPALAALRRGLRAQVKASPLCNAPRFGRSLGAALRHAWRTWCAGR